MTLSVEDFLLSIQKLILGNDLNTTYKLALVLAVTNKAGEIPFLNNSPLKREGFLRPSTDFSTRSDLA